MRPSLARTTRRGLFLALVPVALAILALAGLLIALLPWDGLGPLHLGALAALAVALVGLWSLLTLLDGHFDEVERLRGAILAAEDDGILVPRRWPDGAPGQELARVAAAVDQAQARAGAAVTLTERRLADIVGAADAGLMTVTESGLISLANGAAQAAFARPLRPGTSLFGLVERESWLAAEGAARAAGGQGEAELLLLGGERLAVKLTELSAHGGHLLSLRQASRPGLPALVRDLSLHDRPPEVALDRDTPLAGLPAVVLDGETTGLEVASDRLVSLAAVRLHGGRLFPQLALDRLVNPGVPIPRRATAVHGITDAMVAAAPPAAAVLDELGGFIAGKVVVGHNIGFDLALLAAEAARAGRSWNAPPSLDTGHLAAALAPGLTDLNLEALARHYGVEVEGRHTALGDCLVTAGLWRHLLRLLEAEGIATFGQALAFSRRAEALIGLQRAAGWQVPGRGEGEGAA